MSSPAQQKMKKLKTKSKVVTKRQRRINSEKHIEEREDELPWPPPDEDAIAVYNQLINSSFKLSSSKPSNLLSIDNLSSKINPSKNLNKTMTMELLLGQNPRSIMGSLAAVPSTNYSVMPVVTPASSENVCTLYNNSCHMQSVGRGGPLPPIGVFWDIENCSVPKGRSALVTVQRIRERFFPGHCEAEFVCVCDIRKESPAIIQELNDSQVTVVHVSGNSKNAADDKLRQSMRRFADIYAGHHGCASGQFPATIVLISGDINFSSDLSDLRHRKRLYVILLHNKHAPEALLLCAHEQYDFHSLLSNLPPRPMYRDNFDQNNRQIPLKGGLMAMDVLVCDLPYSACKTQTAIKIRLKKLSENCGGKVITVQGQFALVRFPNKEAALRATKRMNGEDVLGSKIRVIYSSQMEFQSPEVGNAILSSANVPRVREPSLGPTWKPTWKNRLSDTFISSPRPLATRSYTNNTKFLNQPQVPLHHSTPIAAKPQTPPQAPNSSSPCELAREGPSQSHIFGANGTSSSASFLLENSPVSMMKGKQDSSDYFDLHVTNIDPALGDWKIVRHSLITAFAEHVGVKGVWVYVSQDGSVSAAVRVNNKEEAHYAVAQLHRKKFGNKRIFISFDQGGNVDQETLKKEVASLLQDVPGACLPLFKFREMFEKRYRRSVSSSDLYRLRDVVNISESGSNCSLGGNIGRTISLSLEWKNKDDKNVSLYCALHPPKKAGPDQLRTGWAEKEADILLPNVMVEFKTLVTQVHSLLNSHVGGLPIISFLDCYEAEFGKIEVVEPGNGVPLEHLLSCIPGVEVSFADNGMKRVKWNEKKEDTNVLTQPLATQLAQFGREMVDLLKTFPRCSLAFSKLIPAYHHHFGRQCRVADYGHFNLQSLLQTLPHVIQIMGAAQNRILTLSHKAQMKRFATDLLRVLKAHGGSKKQVKVSDFPQAFIQVFLNRQFCPEDYGLCFFSDLISELVENSTLVALVKDEEGNQMLAVPKREQTPQEIHRTKIFASEVIELFRHSIRYEMPFSKFIPAYHHHFGRQCRVSDYGFSKLAELFEAISDTVICVNPPMVSLDCNTEDRLIQLVPQEQVKVVGEQLGKLVQKRSTDGKTIRLNEIDELFIEEHGFQLRPEMCDADSIEDLIVNKLTSYIKVENGCLSAVDQNEMKVLMEDITTILEQNSQFKLDLDEFLSRFRATYEFDLDVATIQGPLAQVLVLSDADESGKRTVALAPLRIFAREISQLLEEVGGSLMISNLEAVYLQKFGQPVRAAQMGHTSLLSLLQAIPDVVQIRGRHRAQKVCLTGLEVSDTLSLEESFRSQKSRYSDGPKDLRNNPRSHSAQQFRNFNQHLKVDTGRWSELPKHRWTHPPSPLYTPTLASPGFTPRTQGEPNVFTFDRPAPLSPPVYDLWMRETMSTGTPPLSPPVVWTYHPIVYPPPNTPPANTGNIMVPTHFSYGAPWSPQMASACFERIPSQSNNMIGAEFASEQQTHLSHGMERLGMEGRNDALNEVWKFT